MNSSSREKLSRKLRLGPKELTKDKLEYLKTLSRFRKSRRKAYSSKMVVVKKIGSKFKLVYHKHSKRKKGFELLEDLEKNRNVNDKKLKNNISRARTSIFEMGMCNDWDYAITITVDKKKQDRKDLNTLIKRFNQSIRNIRRRKQCNPQYLLIPELHKDGLNWHLHGLIKGIPNDEIIKHRDVKLNKKGFFEWTRLTNNFGRNTMDKLYGGDVGKEKLVKYITKYISKDIANGIQKNSKIYYVTKGLNKPKIIKKGRMTEKLQSLLPIDKFENDYIEEYILSPEQYTQVSHLL